MEINEQKVKQGRYRAGKIITNNNNKQTEVYAYV